MARIKRKNSQTGIRIDTAEARSRLPESDNREPHWVSVNPGTSLGYYKGARDRAWFVRQRVGSRYVKQRIGTPDDHLKADGEVVLTHAQAVKRAVNLQLEERAPAPPRHYRDGMTMDDVFGKYLEHRQTHPEGRMNRVMAKSTADISRGSWNLHAGKSIGTKLVSAMDKKALRDWHASIARKPPTKRGKAMAFDKTDPEQVRSRQNTANKLLSLAKAALSWAYRHDLLPATMPEWWRAVAPFGLADVEPRMLEQDEIKRLLNAATPDLRDLISGGLMTGARYGDLIALQVRDYDPDTATVRIAQSKVYKTLQQPLTPEGVALFERLTAGRAPTAPIFTRADGQAWGAGDAAKPMRAALAAAKVEDASFKTLRATYGKLLLVATRDIEMVARALGHSDSRITRKHYARYLPNEVARAVALLPALGIDTASKVSRIAGKKRRAG